MNRLLQLSLAFLFVLSYSCNKEKRFAITTEPPIEVYGCRATLKATGKNGSSKKIFEKGFVYSTGGSPVYGDNTSPSTNGFVDLFEAEVKSLKVKTKYYVRAYTKFKDGSLVYGNEIEFQTTDVYQPGDTGPAGGTIYATDLASSSGKYSEALLSSYGYFNWGCSGTELSGLSLTSGSGMNNSITIASSCGAGTAAAYCVDLTFSGFSDWYLPNIGELQLLQSFSKSNPNTVSSGLYWSSSQWDDNMAYGIDMAGSSEWLKIAKSEKKSVVAVRKFN